MPPGERPGPAPTPVPTPADRRCSPASAPGPSIASLALAQADASAALASFAESCPKLLRRTDASGLTRAEDWQPACGAAAGWPRGDAARFFADQFETAVVGDGAAFVTGYYEPEIAGSRTRRPGFEVPVYAMPPDLVRAWPAETPPEQRSGRAPLGRYDEQRQASSPTTTAPQIEDGALAGRGLEIAWAADPIELFFLQIQGSGRLRSPEGEVIRIGYAGQNGRDYVGIGGAACASAGCSAAARGNTPRRCRGSCSTCASTRPKATR